MQVLTSVGWITGTMHVPVKSSLLEHLNHARDFLALTGVRFSMRPDMQLLPFFAVQRSAAIVMLAAPNEQYQNVKVEETRMHAVSCLLELGTIDGRFKTLKDVRISDYISAQSAFFLMEDCDLALKDRWGRTLIEDRRPQAIVNVQHLIGITEGQPEGGG